MRVWNFPLLAYWKVLTKDLPVEWDLLPLLTEASLYSVVFTDSADYTPFADSGDETPRIGPT